jgi:hypothetical protein
MPRLRLIVCLALASAGCKEDEGIRAYTVPRLRQSPPRMLAAMIPNGEKVWFVKLSGSEEKVAAEKAAFEQFISSLRFRDSAPTPLAWTLPEGWREAGGKTPTRFATLRAGPDSLEMSITSLGKEAGDLKNNVNRWRGQLGLKPVADDTELAALSKPIMVDGHAGHLIDLVGATSESPAAAAPREFSPNAPEQSRPLVSRSQPTESKPISYSIPSGWTEIPASGMRAAAFRVADGNQSAEVTVISLGGPSGGLLANVNRWRTQIGLAETTEDKLAKESKSLEVAGQNAVYVDLVGQEKRTLGVILPHDGKTWFLKLQGPLALIEKERANFEAFARSVRFVAGGGS